MDNDTLLRALLKDYIIYTRLSSGLCNIGLSTDDFVFNLGDTIFQFMELRDDDLGNQRFDEFLTAAEKIVQYDLSEWQSKIAPLVDEVHDLILQWKKEAVDLIKN